MSTANICSFFYLYELDRVEPGPACLEKRGPEGSLCLSTAQPEPRSMALLRGVEVDKMKLTFSLLSGAQCLPTSHCPWKQSHGWLVVHPAYGEPARAIG